ncbi:MAG: hypothetical protein ACRDVW_07960 [Acidimicrobiales bacterium]
MIEILEHSAALEGLDVATSARTKAAELARRRAVPLTMIVVLVGATMAYTTGWGPVVRHHSYWIAPGDLWGTFHTAQYVAWGDIGDVYNSGSGLVSLPGISVLLAPAALIINHLGLSISFPYEIAHPSAWWVLGPYETALGAIVLVPLDTLAEHLGVSGRSRIWCSIFGAIVLFPVLGIWGHPEDSVALAFAIWGLLAALRHRWRAAGWLFGAALVMQPLVVLMAPVVVAMAPRREWPKLALRGALPSLALVAIPLAQAWRQTTTALFKQPNYPSVDHPTPWLSLAPVLTKVHRVKVQHIFQVTHPNGSTGFKVTISHTLGGLAVAAGPGRLIAIGLAVVIGVYAARRRPSMAEVVWLCCLALSLRCVFESVMDPYYLWPPIALALPLVMRSHWRTVASVVGVAAMTWWSYKFLGPWQWWAPITVVLLLVVAMAKPSSDRLAKPSVRGEPMAKNLSYPDAPLRRSLTNSTVV